MTQTNGAEWKSRAVCPPHIVANFAGQLSIMLHNGVGIVEALDTLRHQDEYPNFGVIVQEISKQIFEGNSFSSGVAEYPKVFPKVFCALVKVGESTGNLAGALDKIALWMNRDYKAAKGVKSALTYPLFVLGFSLALTLLLFYTVLPQFLQMFDGLGIELPLITRVVLTITKAVRLPGFWTLLVVFSLALFLGLKEAWSDPKGRLVLYTALLRVPLLGRLLIASSASRYACALELTVNTGQSLPRSLTLTAAACGNPLIQADAPHLISSIEGGSTVAAHMESQEGLYPRVLVQMIEIGEESADIPEMVSRAGDYYEEEAQLLTSNLGALIEPIMLSGVALVVGTVLVSIFLPLYSIVGQMAI